MLHKKAFENGGNAKLLTQISTDAMRLFAESANDNGKSSKQHLKNLILIMKNPVYRALFTRTRLVTITTGELVIETSEGGGCRCVTVSGATTGFGADIIIIDDAMKADEINSEARRDELDRFYSGALLTRLNTKRRGLIISIQQRLGEDDLPNRLIEAGAEHLSLPAHSD